MTNAISIAGLIKNFGDVRALAGLDLEVETGEVHGLLGPNGAGKSTAIRVLLGLLRADAGSVCVLGGDPWHDVVDLHRRIAYVPGDVSLWPNMTGGEAIDLLGKLRGGLDETRRAHLLDRFELDPRKKGRTYSKGNRQKVAIVAALASDVELLILDEPTSGLDPLMELIFQEEISAEKSRGRTILLSSHILSEAEALADRISIIRAGRIVETGSLADMRKRAHALVRARFAGAAPEITLPGLHEVSVHDGYFSCRVDADAVGALVNQLAQHSLVDLSVTPPSLEDMFRKHYNSAEG